MQRCLHFGTTDDVAEVHMNHDKLFEGLTKTRMNGCMQWQKSITGQLIFKKRTGGRSGAVGLEWDVRYAVSVVATGNWYNILEILFKYTKIEQTASKLSWSQSNFVVIFLGRGGQNSKRGSWQKQILVAWLISEWRMRPGLAAPEPTVTNKAVGWRRRGGRERTRINEKCLEVFVEFLGLLQVHCMSCVFNYFYSCVVPNVSVVLDQFTCMQNNVVLL